MYFPIKYTVVVVVVAVGNNQPNRSDRREAHEAKMGNQMNGCMNAAGLGKPAKPADMLPKPVSEPAAQPGFEAPGGAPVEPPSDKLTREVCRALFERNAASSVLLESSLSRNHGIATAAIA